MFANGLEAYGRMLVRKRAPVSVLIVVLTILALFGITERLRQGDAVDFTPQAMFMGESGGWTRLKGYEAEFGVEDNTVIALIEGPVDSLLGVELLRSLHEAVAVVPGVDLVDSVVNGSIADIDSIGMIRVQDAIGPENSLERAAKDPFLSPLLIATDRSAASLQIHIDDSLQEIADLGPVVNAATAALRSVDLPEAFKLHMTGVPFVRTEVVKLMMEDEMIFLPAVAGMFFVIIMALFRRFWLGMAPLTGVLVATVWTMGVLLSTGSVLNILSALTPVLVLVIGVADGIHLVGRYREELAKDGHREAAMGRTTRHMALACFLTTFTTAAGFASLAVADTAVIRDFGTQVATGVMVTFSAVLLVVPTLLAWIPVFKVGAPTAPRERAAYSRAASFVTSHPRRVLAAALAVTMVAGWLGRTVQTDSALLEMYKPDHPTWLAVHTAEAKTGGIIPVFIHFSGEPDQMLEPDVLKRIDALEHAFKKEPFVGYTASHAGWLKHFHHLLTGSDGWPSTRAAASQELLLAELSGDLPLDRVLSVDRARARIIALIDDAGGRAVLEGKARIEAAAETIFEGSGVDVDVTGDGMLAAFGVYQLIRDLLASLGLMVGVIFITMLLLLRDLKLTLIATFPNVVPLVFILGMLGVLGVDLQTSNIVSFTIAVGLAVDDTIHFMVRYREEKSRGLDTPSAIEKTFQGAGHAIVLTSILLIFGFGVLAFSSLTSTYFFGLLAGVTMAAAIVGDLIILPALLTLFDRK